MLRSQFKISHSMIIALLQRGQDQELPGSGYRELIGIINDCFETVDRKRRLRRETAMLFRSLRTAGVVRIEPAAGGALARVDAELQRDFGLHHTLSLYLVDAVAALDPASTDYGIDVLSVVEAILENPRALLEAQLRQRKTELIAELKAARVPYEERMEKLEGMTWDKPNAEFLYATFDVFTEHHPWAGTDSVRPKSIAREIWEGFLSFDDYVRRYGIARLEGVLLRYLNQVHSTLARNIPESAHNDEVVEIIAFFRAMLARVDSSLIEEWENLVQPGASKSEDSATDLALPDRAPRKLDIKAFKARARAEMHQLMQAISRGDYEAAVAALSATNGSTPDAATLEAECAAIFVCQPSLRCDPEARLAHWTRIEARGDLEFEVIQTLIDAEGEGSAQIETEIILEEARMPSGPMLKWCGVRA